MQVDVRWKRANRKWEISTSFEKNYFYMLSKLLSNMNLKRKHNEELELCTWSYVSQIKSLQERNYFNSFCIIYIHLQHISSILILITGNAYYKQLQQEQWTVKTWKY